MTLPANCPLAAKANGTPKRRRRIGAGCAYPACLALLTAVAWAVVVWLGRVTW